MLAKERIEQLAEHLDGAAADVRTVPMLTAELPDLTLDEAYAIQFASVARRYARGDARIGLKMGLTSRAKMQQMGVHQPIMGHLTARMAVEDGGSISRKAHVHPRVEPEIVFIMARDVRGPVTSATVMRSVEAVACGLEVVDSRYQDFRFTLRDVVADNTSASHFVVSSSLFPPRTDLSCLGVVLYHNGKVAETGCSAAILEHPARALAELVNMLAVFDRGLQAGDIVLSGAATAAVAVQPGDVLQVDVHRLGTASLRVGE